MERFRVIIPARYASTRLPGKPLLPIGGKPLIEHVWRRALESACCEAWVATDDRRIAEAVEGFGGQVVMTSPHHLSGTDRLAEVAASLGLGDSEIVVNLQGDEPFIPGAQLGQLAAALAAHPACGLATFATPIHDAAELFDPNVVKVVTADDGRALYFSRAPIPFQRGAFSLSSAPPAGLPPGTPFQRHLGLYAYRVATLRAVTSAPPSKLELAESLEQLRALAIGISIHVSFLEHAPGPGIDTPEDLLRAEQLLKGT
jgi:3-deoxy-manno-octulosonate cytidylyltransferase (CMP-KDO synthetase)